MRPMCGVQLKVGKISTDMMFMLCLNETMDQLAMENCICWYGYVLRRALDFEVEGQRKKGRPKGHGRRRLWKKVWRLV